MPRARSSIDWSSSYAVAGWRLSLVDVSTWADAGVIGGTVGASVTRDATSALLESGSVDVEGAVIAGERWGRIEALVRQGGVTERHAVATLLLVPGASKVRRGSVATTLDGRSVLAPAHDEKMLAGSYVPRGADGAEWAAHLLSECTPAPVVVAGGFALADHVVYERKTTHLEAAKMLLDAGGWCLQVDGDGTIRMGPRPTEPALTLTPRLLRTEVEADDGRAGVPNRVTAYHGGVEGMAVDDDPESPTSHARRGRWVDVVDESPKLLAGESVQGYAERILAERLGVGGKRTYTRAWVPGVVIQDVIRATLPDARLVGDLRVTSQEISLGKGVDVSETVEVMT